MEQDDGLINTTWRYKLCIIIIIIMMMIIL